MNFSGTKNQRSAQNPADKGTSVCAVAAWICLLGAAQSFGEEASLVVVGELTLDGGVVRVWDCNRHREVRTLGLAPAKYEWLANKRSQVSEDGKFKVVVEIRGTIRPGVASGGQSSLVVTNPTFLSFIRGSCSDVKDLLP
jgi:hypothetical protein